MSSSASGYMSSCVSSYISSYVSSYMSSYMSSYISSYVSGCVSSYISSCVASSLLYYKVGESVINILINTSNNSREDRYKEIDIGTNINIGVEIGVSKVINILIEVEGYRVGF
jgi:hypothetical protein